MYTLIFRVYTRSCVRGRSPTTELLTAMPLAASMRRSQPKAELLERYQRSPNLKGRLQLTDSGWGVGKRSLCLTLKSDAHLRLRGELALGGKEAWFGG